MFELKTISVEGIARAQEKAHRYRLLNEPRDAESIFRDILRVDSDNQDALKGLLLSLTDQFGRALRVNIGHVHELLPRLQDEYSRTYYSGVICERWAKAQLEEGSPGYVIFDWFAKAMEWYEKAEPLAPQGNEDARLRYNACARMIKRNENVRPRPEDDDADAFLQDDVPLT